MTQTVAAFFAVIAFALLVWLIVRWLRLRRISRSVRMGKPRGNIWPRS